MSLPIAMIAATAAAVHAAADEARLALVAARKQCAGAERELLDLVNAVIQNHETTSRLAVMTLWVLERRRAGPWKPAPPA
jgi:hypothetical protein